MAGDKMRLMLVICLVLSILTIGCAPGSTDIVLECTPPLIHKGDGCCMDADRNGVCDIDEKPAETEPEEEEQAQPEETEAAPAQEQPESAEEVAQPEETPAQPAKNTKEEAESTAKLFVTSWQKKQYNVMYTFFVQSLKSRKTSTEFTAIMELDPFYKKIDKLDLNGVTILDDKTAEMDIVAHTNVQDISIPAARLKFTGGEWKVSAFVDVFELEAYYAACTGYRYNNQYDMEDCANDFARKVKNSSYCNLSGCHYTECLKFLGKTVTYVQEAEQCKMCQPVGKTINDCILDVAINRDKIAACNVIAEDRYNDKYCVCYGGFARHKGTSGYCNMIENEDNKYLCMKGYDGGYC
ncbi:hypothetical protein KY359_03770, partial [Candidatus Woesearchaeota archaeon]|nr:hypothetical protein [Candidatus Woesearchaeota archaeon]